MISTQRVYLLLVLCVLFWSGNFVLGRFVNAQIEPLELAFFRWLFVIILSSPVLFFIDIKKVLKTIKENFLLLSFLAIVGITVFNTVLYIALQTTTATNALLINSIIPILILVISFFILKKDITSRQVFGIVLSTIGVIFLVLKGNLFNILEITFTKGDLWVLLSSLLWATYSVVVKFKPKALSHIELFLVIVYLGFIYLLPWYFMQGYNFTHEISVLKENWYFFLYVSLFASILSFYFWHIGIDTISAEKTGQFTHLMPIFGSILAFIFLGEKLELYHIFGALLIGSGIYLSLFLKK